MDLDGRLQLAPPGRRVAEQRHEALLGIVLRGIDRVVATAGDGRVRRAVSRRAVRDRGGDRRLGLRIERDALEAAELVRQRIVARLARTAVARAVITVRTVVVEASAIAPPASPAPSAAPALARVEK